MKRTQIRSSSGFISLIGSVVILVIAIIAAGAIYYVARQEKTINTNTTSINTSNVNRNTNQTSNTNYAIAIPADWKTYTNEEYGFRLKYPSLLTIDAQSTKPVNTSEYLIADFNQNGATQFSLNVSTKILGGLGNMISDPDCYNNISTKLINGIVWSTGYNFCAEMEGNDVYSLSHKDYVYEMSYDNSTENIIKQILSTLQFTK